MLKPLCCMLPRYWSSPEDQSCAHFQLYGSLRFQPRAPSLPFTTMAASDADGQGTKGWLMWLMWKEGLTQTWSPTRQLHRLTEWVVCTHPGREAHRASSLSSSHPRSLELSFQRGAMKREGWEIKKGQGASRQTAWPQPQAAPPPTPPQHSQFSWR